MSEYVLGQTKIIFLTLSWSEEGGVWSIITPHSDVFHNTSRFSQPKSSANTMVHHHIKTVVQLNAGEEDDEDGCGGPGVSLHHIQQHFPACSRA